MDVPPYNGFGTDEDSLGSYKYLVLKPPKKDYAKFNKHINDVLRFKAEMVDSAPEDIGREFIVCFYLADDTMQVFEQTKRNSGHNGGKVFARAKLPGYGPENMHTGEVINVNGQRYRLTQTDLRTARFMAGESRVISDEEVQRCVVAIRSLLNQRYSRITEAFRRYSRGKVGIALEDLRQLMLDAEIPSVTDDLVFHIMAMIDSDKDGFVSYQEFVLGLMQHTEGSGVAREDPSKKTVAEAGASDPSLYLATHGQQQRRRFTDKVLKTFCEKLEARRAVLVDAFRMVTDKSLDGLVGTEEFKSVVMDLMGLNFTEDEMDALTERFFAHEHIKDWRNRRLNLQQFRRVMDQVL
jgi:EF-hand domain-containing protein 1